MRFEHAFADLGGVARERLSDLQALGARDVRTDARRRDPATLPLDADAP